MWMSLAKCARYWAKMLDSDRVHPPKEKRRLVFENYDHSSNNADGRYCRMCESYGASRLEESTERTHSDIASVPSHDPGGLGPDDYATSSEP